MKIKKSYCSPISVFLIIAVIALATPAMGRQSSAFEFDPDYPVGTPPILGGTGQVTEEDDGDGWYNANDFGEYSETYYGMHSGEDWNDEGKGNTDVGDPVYAIAGGTVFAIKEKVFKSGDYGSGIVIEHTLPNGERLYSVYVHIDIASGLSEGDFVGQGDRIGSIADTTSVTPHLHFEIRTKPVGEDWYPNDNGNGYYASKEDLLADGLIDPSDFIDSSRHISYAAVDSLLVGEQEWQQSAYISDGNIPTNIYSGVATSNVDGDIWPFKLTLIGPDMNGLIDGQIEWTTLNAIHKIEGFKTPTGITFKETDYIKKGDALLNCRYYLTPDGSSFTGTWDSCGGDNGYINANPWSRDIDSNIPTNIYSGAATSNVDGDIWPFKLTLIGPDMNGLIDGQIEWTTLNAIHKIEGFKTPTGITFKETDYIKKGDALLNCRYYLTPDGSSFTGTWDSCGGDNGYINANL